MTPDLVWWLALATSVAAAAVWRMWRTDIDARRAAETRASDLADRLAAAVSERDEAMDRAREWMAEAEARTADHERHLARCLGELTPQNDGAMPWT